METHEAYNLYNHYEEFKKVLEEEGYWVKESGKITPKDSESQF